MPEVADSGIAKHFFQQSYQLYDTDHRPLANVYWANADHGTDSHGCLYLIHGYGGSPMEPCMQLPMHNALRHGFDVVAIEGCDLSATCGVDKDVTKMTLQRQKMAILHALKYAKAIDVNHSHNIAWVHSISCRALSDLMVRSVFVRKYFHDIVLNNPYFMAPPKVIKLKEKLMRSDPTGRAWEKLILRVSNMTRDIDNRSYTVPTRVYNLTIPLPLDWEALAGDGSGLARKISPFVKNTRLYFVLGTADNMADYQQNVEFFGGLQVPNKQLLRIDGADHSFENAQAQYDNMSRAILKQLARVR